MIYGAPRSRRRSASAGCRRIGSVNIALWPDAKRRLVPRRTRSGRWMARAYLWLWMLASPVFSHVRGNILFTRAAGLPHSRCWWPKRGPPTGSPRSFRRFDQACGPRDTGPDRAWRGIRHSSRRTELSRTRHWSRNTRPCATTIRSSLVYLAEAPQSAEFYSRGKAATAKSAADLDRFLNDRQAQFLRADTSAIRCATRSARPNGPCRPVMAGIYSCARRRNQPSRHSSGTAESDAIRYVALHLLAGGHAGRSGGVATLMARARPRNGGVT